jgi:hypothetical protein
MIERLRWMQQGVRSSASSNWSFEGYRSMAGLPFISDGRADATTGIGKKVEWTGS